MRAKITAIAVAVAFVLTGCGTDNGAEDKYLASVNKNGSYELNQNSQESLVELGHTVCEATEEQGPAAMINTVAENPEVMGARDFGVLVGAATNYLCPDQRQAWLDYANSVDNVTTL